MKKLFGTLLIAAIGISLETVPVEPVVAYPQDYFRSPVSHFLLLSGTFGELRPNHFHAGIDIKSSRGVIGDPIYAAAGGYIARMKVDESGYGNSLFINHPNGYTTVYAHLEKFSPELQDFIKRQQYTLKSFNVDLEIPVGQIPIFPGQEIGVMGNTGASNGAHLHFEVRHTESQNPVNPLLFNFPVTDNTPPKMHTLRVYLLNENREEVGSINYPVYLSNGKYRVKGDTISVKSGKAGFALKVYDHFDKVSNWNGIYRLSMYDKDDFSFGFDFEKFSFDETRYINAHCDYVERVAKNSYFNRTFSLPGNRLSIYQKQANDGVLNLDAQPRKIIMVAADIAGNTSNLEFWVKKAPTPSALPTAERKYNYYFPFDEGNQIRTEDFFMSMTAGTLYENLYLKYLTTPENSSNHYSLVHHLHQSKTPIHNYFDIGIRPETGLPETLKSKAFIAYCEGSSVMNTGGKWKDGMLYSRVRAFGDYCIMTDIVPPVIKPLNFLPNMKGISKITFRISDNFRTAPNVSGLSYNAYIDGEWILMEFDKKSALLTHHFDNRIESGEHEFKMIVSDAVGNEAVFEKKFTR